MKHIFFNLILGFLFISLAGNIDANTAGEDQVAIEAKPATEDQVVSEDKAAEKVQTFEDVIKNNQFLVPTSNNSLSHMHEASTLLISCVDFRLRDETEKLMRDVLKLIDNYDEISIPGAALAFVTDKYAHWGKTLEDSIGILKGLHHIKRVVFLDHRGCGAYNLIKGKEHAATPEKERMYHLEVFKEARAKMSKDFPDIEVYTLLMGLDGTVENVK